MVGDTARPIGIFDSGVGGLTVARAVIDLLPHEDLVYFGDTAHLPYGPRPGDEIRKFALEIMDALVAEDVKMLVIACNAASSTALDEARERYAVPVISVIEPGVRAAAAITRTGRVGLIGTLVTVRSRAYDHVMGDVAPGIRLFSEACPAFVDFVERGDTTSADLIRAAEEYLRPLQEAHIDTLILGCTHYPLLSGVIQYVMGPEVVLVSSAEVTAKEVYAELRERNLLGDLTHSGKHRFVASSRGYFSELGKRFLGPEFGEVEYRPWDRA